MRKISLLLLSASLLAAAPVDELLVRLRQFNGADPVKVRLSHSYSRVNGEGADARTDEAEVLLIAQATPEGLTLSWDSAQLAPSSEATSDEKAAPPARKKRSLGAISPQTVAEYINVAGAFEQRLKDAVLLEDKADTYQGSPARLLVLKLDPHLKPQDKKYIKQIDAQARIWLDAQGCPLAAETSMALKGRAFLVISFDSHEKETFRFSKVGGRLIVAYHEKQGGGSGAGEKGTSRESTSLELL